MPIKNFNVFEKSFYRKGIFDIKIYEQYWNDDDNNDNNEYEDWDDLDDWINISNKSSYNSDMYSKINLDKLYDISLYEYKDIVKNCIIYFEEKISLKTYENVIPSVDVIKEYIINSIGDDYLDYISILKLNKLSEYIYNEIENYIYD